MDRSDPDGPFIKKLKEMQDRPGARRGMAMRIYYTQKNAEFDVTGDAHIRSLLADILESAITRGRDADAWVEGAMKEINKRNLRRARGAKE
jgi:hypothetical protein